MNTKNSKTNESHKFVLNLSQRLGSISSNKHVALQNLSLYYTWKNIRKQYKTKKLMMRLNYPIVLILCQIFQITLNISLKN